MLTSDLDQLPVLHEGVDTVIYRSSDRNGQPVVYKVLRSSSPDARALAELNNEHGLLGQASIEGVRPVLGRGSLDGRHHLVLGFVEGQPLAVAQTLDLAGQLRVAIATARTLQGVHRHGLIHKHLTSDNLLVDLRKPLQPRVTLIDFGIASTFNRKPSPRGSPAVLQGTLRYTSPEQTGRMNRIVDYRTDMYSLGCVLYELFTGAVPFHPESDPMRLVHCHIAQRPTPASEVAAVPRALSDVVSRLLAKNAEDRYQSAHGLTADLEHCLSELEATEAIAPFPVATSDASGRLQIPQKLYGRQTQIDHLMSAFERVSQGSVELVLVTGSSGVGKSTLVSEVHRPITERSGYFISGKYEQFNRDVPYSALSRAVEAFCDYVLTESDQRFERMRAAILEETGTNAQILIDLFPRLELVLGRQPDVASVGPLETQNRFNSVMQQFMRAVGRRDHPLVLFLDDLQWADTASLNALGNILDDETCSHLMIVGAYRDNEVDCAHPLARMLDAIGAATVSEIAVGSLATDDVSLLVSETLATDPPTSRALADVMVERSGGNAFFTVETLKWLVDNGLLEFGFADQRWKIDLERIADGRLPTDVLALTRSRLGALQTEASAALTVASLIGHVFDLDTLSSVIGETPKQVLDDIWEAVEVEFIAPLDDSYLLIEEFQGRGPSFKFKHDRFLQAAHFDASAMDPDERANIHLHIGRRHLSQTTGDLADARIFDIVSHLNRGQSAMKTVAERLELARLNRIAAEKARQSTAYPTAIKHLERALAIYETQGWEEQHEALFDALLELAANSYLSGVFDRAEQCYSELLERRRTVAEEAKVRAVQNVQFQLQGRFAEALEVQRLALNLLGLEVPDSEAEALAERQVEVAKFEELLGDRSIASLLDAPELERDDVLSMQQILNDMLITAYCLRSRQELVHWTGAKMARLSVEFGRSEMCSAAFVNHSILYGQTLDNFDRAYELGELALAFSEQFDNLVVRGIVWEVFFSCCLHWKTAYRSTREVARRTLDYCMVSGGFAHASYALLLGAYYELASGEELSVVHADVLEGRKILARTSPFSLAWYQPCLQHIACLRGLTDSELSLDNEDFNEAEHARQHAGMPLVLSWVWGPKLQLAFLFGRYDEALALIDKAEETAMVRLAQPVGPEMRFLVSLVLAACYPEAAPEEQASYLKKIEHNQRRMRACAASCEANYLHKLLLVEAEHKRILGEAAGPLYDRAIVSAREHQFTNHEALANELAARFWLRAGDRDRARSYLTESRDRFQQWGAVNKVAQLEREYAELLD